MSVEVRKTEEHVYDGTSGDQVDTISRYELGAEVEGAWVKFASLSADHVDGIVARHKAAQEGKDTGSNQPQGDTGAPSMASNAAPHE